MLLRAYAKRTRKADTAAADVISTLSAAILGGKINWVELGRNSIPFRFRSTLAIHDNWLNLVSYLLLLTRLICNWPRGGAPGPIAIGTREGIGDSGKRVPTKKTYNRCRQAVGPHSDSESGVNRARSLRPNACSLIPAALTALQNGTRVEPLGCCSRYVAVPPQDRRARRRV